MIRKKRKKNGLQIQAVHAQAVHYWLQQNALLEKKLKPIRTKTIVVFPLVSILSASEKKFLKKNFAKSKIRLVLFEHQQARNQSLKQLLKPILTKKEMKKLVGSFDTLGNIAIIEISKELEKKEKAIGTALLQTNASIKTVCKKTGAHKGRYRIEPVKIIAGKRELVAGYKESGCHFRIHVGKTFFSPRLSHERRRIAALIKKGEVIGAFFAGVGPFPIVFAKNSSMQKAIAIELNPVAFKDLKYNIMQNKLEEQIEAVQGDVKKVLHKRFHGAFDRVVMPLPKGGEDFLKEALISLKAKGGVVHFYAFVAVENPFEAVEARIKRIAKKNGFSIKIILHKQVRSFSKDLIQVAIDFYAKKEGL